MFSLATNGPVSIIPARERFKDGEGWRRRRCRKGEEGATSARVPFQRGLRSSTCQNLQSYSRDSSSRVLSSSLFSSDSRALKRIKWILKTCGQRISAVVSLHDDLLNIAGLQPVPYREAAAESAKSKDKTRMVQLGPRVEANVSGLAFK